MQRRIFMTFTPPVGVSPLGSPRLNSLPEIETVQVKIALDAHTIGLEALESSANNATESGVLGSPYIFEGDDFTNEEQAHIKDMLEKSRSSEKISSSLVRELKDNKNLKLSESEEEAAKSFEEKVITPPKNINYAQLLASSETESSSKSEEGGAESSEERVALQPQAKVEDKKSSSASSESEEKAEESSPEFDEASQKWDELLKASSSGDREAIIGFPEGNKGWEDYVLSSVNEEEPKVNPQPQPKEAKKSSASSSSKSEEKVEELSSVSEEEPKVIPEPQPKEAKKSSASSSSESEEKVEELSSVSEEEPKVIPEPQPKEAKKSSASSSSKSEEKVEELSSVSSEEEPKIDPPLQPKEPRKSSASSSSKSKESSVSGEEPKDNPEPQEGKGTEEPSIDPTKPKDPPLQPKSTVWLKVSSIAMMVLGSLSASFAAFAYIAGTAILGSLLWTVILSGSLGLGLLAGGGKLLYEARK